VVVVVVVVGVGGRHTSGLSDNLENRGNQ
jgi:hypothetical protein